ncbi:MAG: hypothetical protein CL676_00240 [Bdellovibrionaceae bacterium]|nr:hypothetical protein [Pseudobdellovibrionaceae bacterium]
MDGVKEGDFLKVAFVLQLVISLFLFSSESFASIEAYFHPYDSTFEKIAAQIDQVQSTMDIAMYNMDHKESNPIIAKLASPSIQKKIKSGQLKVRIVFNGKPNRVGYKLEKFEELGIDARYIGLGKKIHHKFAVMDSRENTPRLITGSANWSQLSREHYSENIMFFVGESEVAVNFQKEFDLLWSLANEYGREEVGSTTNDFLAAKDRNPSIQSFFNTENFKVRDGRLVDDDSKEGFELTREVVREIDGARKSLEIASTRLKLRPVFDALLRAASRGVKIDFVVTMAEYQTLSYRKDKEVPPCKEEYSQECSESHNYTVFLARHDYPGSENVHVRVKYFDFNPKGHLAKQMHSKYMIVDAKKVCSGSFNWSYSAEYSHIENLVCFDGRKYKSALKSFEADFDYTFNLRRQDFEKLKKEFSDRLNLHQYGKCSFAPISLEFEQLDEMFELEKKYQIRFMDICS